MATASFAAASFAADLGSIGLESTALAGESLAVFAASAADEGLGAGFAASGLASAVLWVVSAAWFALLAFALWTGAGAGLSLQLVNRSALRARDPHKAKVR